MIFPPVVPPALPSPERINPACGEELKSRYLVRFVLHHRWAYKRRFRVFFCFPVLPVVPAGEETAKQRSYVTSSSGPMAVTMSVEEVGKVGLRLLRAAMQVGQVVARTVSSQHDVSSLAIEATSSKAGSPARNDVGAWRCENSASMIKRELKAL